MTSTIINQVIKIQNTTVDTVSGATVTSKAYLKSIENALTQ
ncbi:FMN-binding protein [Acetobacterium carbinolicum]